MVRSGRSPRRIAALVVAAAALLAACGGGSSPAASPPAGSAPGNGMPSPAAARSIVATLWSQREQALAGLDASALATADTAGARIYDRGNVALIKCGCEPPKDRHPIDRIRTLIPRDSADGSFLAQVQTSNSHGQKPWYVIAVTRDHADEWKIGFVAFGWYKAKPPLTSVTHADGYTAPVTAAHLTRIARLAAQSVTYARTHNRLTAHTSYGARVRARPQLRPGPDGVYGIALRSGKVLACFTLHELDTYSLKGGLAQGADREEWGPLLAPGAYRRVTTDAALPECTVGSGSAADAGQLVLRYDRVVVGVTGARLS